MSLAAKIGALLGSSGVALDPVFAVGTPAGVIVPFGGATAPSGWLLAFGQAVSRTAYPALFSAIGTAHGVGDGSTTFNLPDCRGRVIAGKDNMGGTAANRLTTGGGGVNGSVLGHAAGTETHTLTTAQMPAHNHAVTDPGHAHNVTAAANFVAPTNSNAGYDDLQSRGGSVAGHVYSNTTGISIQNNGSGTAHPNVQPSIVLNAIIKT